MSSITIKNLIGRDILKNWRQIMTRSMFIPQLEKLYCRCRMIRGMECVEWGMNNYKQLFIRSVFSLGMLAPVLRIKLCQFCYFTSLKRFFFQC